MRKSMIGYIGDASPINLDDQGLTGPSIFRGDAQAINVTVDTITATFTGGVILKSTTNFRIGTKRLSARKMPS